MPQLSASEIEARAIELVKLERQNWEDATAFITDRVAFQMRNLIRQLRKNYWGIFNEPVDPATGRKKIWIPLTESLVESVVKNIDLDTKDINIRAAKEETIGLAALVRQIVKHYLDEMQFGQYLDDMERALAIDGTAVWKTIERKDEDGDYCIDIVPVDLLNVYIDPTAPSIKEAYRFTERGLLTEEEVKSHAGWMNTKGIEGTLGLNRTDPQYRYYVSSRGSKYVDVWEMWGKIPKSLISGNSDDKDEIEGHIIVSGLEPNKPRVHLIEQNKDKRPYTEFWYTRVPGRWYGKGVAEKVFMLQLWINTIMNIRINRSYLAQMGLFLVRKGSGVTPQMLSRLPANGAVVVNSLDDIEQLQMQDASDASYRDEQVIWDWGQKVTSAYDSAIGAPLPASTPATNAAIQAQGAHSQFELIKEGVGMRLQYWMNEFGLPTILKNIDRNDVVEIVGNDEVAELDKQIVYRDIYEQLEKINATGGFVDPNQIQNEIQRGLDKLSSFPKQRYVKLLHDLDDGDYIVKVDITNESFDKAVLAQNLIQMLQIAPSLPGIPVPTIVKEIMDIMGLDIPAISNQPQQQPQQNQNNQMMQQNPQTRPGGNPPAQGQIPSLASLVAGANTQEPNQQ